MSDARHEWTGSQLTALRRRGNTIVSAAAGSGKTTVMTEKIVRLIRGGADLREMLVVTFTRAAATQLREKIRKNLSEAASGGDKDAAEQLAALPLAEIGTIHTFCSRLIRENFGLLGVPANFSVAEEKEAEILQKKAIAETVDDLFDKPADDGEDGGIAFVCDVIGKTKDPDAAARTLVEIYNELRRGGYDETKLLEDADRLDENADKDFLSTPWGETVAEAAGEMAAHYRSAFDELTEGLRETEKIWKEYGPAAVDVRDYFAVLSDALEEKDYLRVRAVMGSFPKTKLGRLKQDEKTEDAEMFSALRTEAKIDVDKHLAAYFSASPEQIADSMRNTARVLRSVSRVLGCYAEKYESLKRRQGKLDFQDLETLAHRLLVGKDGGPTEAALRIGRKYRFIFIDEYQDTNRVQDEIFRAVGAGAERFMVGDVKQSVYRFRGAEPEIFSGYRRRWPAVPEAEEDGDDISEPRDAGVFMSDNFRCSRPIVRFVNAVSDFMFRGGDVPFEDRDMLHPSTSSEVDAPVEVRILEKGEKGPTEEEYVADRIKEMIGTAPFGGEPLKASDFAVIHRRANQKVGGFAKELLKRGIPVAESAGASVSDAADVHFAVDLLRAVDNPHRDVPLCNVMMSSLFSFTLDEMTRIRLEYPEGSLFSSVIGMSGEGDGPLREKCAAFRDRIRYFRETERSLGASVFVERLFRETGLAMSPEISSAPDGEKHLRALMDQAREYEKNSYGGLYGFLGYLEDLELGGGLRSAVGGSEGVTITTVHGSKGLEYKVCFFCGTGSYMKNPAGAGVVFGKDLGWAVMLPDPGGLVRCRTPVMEAVCAGEQKRERYEELRLIYVAMTRAVHKLIVVAKHPSRSVDSLLGQAAKNARFRDGYTVQSLGSEIDYILAAGERCAEKVFDLDTVTRTEDVADAPEESATAADAGKPPADPEKVGAFVDFAEERFSAEYPHSFLGDVPSKLSVSRLYPDVLSPEDGVTDLERDEEERDGDRRMELPSFMTGVSVVTGRDRGIATHSFLQFADFDRLRDGSAADELRRLVEQGFLSEEAGRLVSLNQAEKFRRSALFRRIADGRRVWREFRFNVLLPAEKFTQDRSRAEKFREEDVRITVQGVFDCVFEDADGRLVVADYKTDFMSEEDRRDTAGWIARLRERHALQLRYYREAAALLFGRDPDEVLIYSLPLGDTIDMKNA